VAVWNFSTFFFHLLFYEIRNRSYLRLISSLTDYKIIRYSFRYFAQVKRNNVLSFFLLICLSFFFLIFLIIVLMIFELFVSRVALFFLRVVSNASCSNNQIIFCLLIGRQV